jgi:hypothetical protein
MEPFFVAMKTLFTVLFLAVFSSCLSAQRDVTGTYRISVCKTRPCIAGDSTHAVAVGVLVLLDSAILPAALPASAGRLLTRYSHPYRANNACYDLKRIGVNRTSYAGGVAGTHWKLEGKDGTTITFGLYRSPDAFHSVIAKIRGDHIAGVGRSSGSGVTAVDWPRDTVVATRSGPADVNKCIRASIRESRGFLPAI